MACNCKGVLPVGLTLGAISVGLAIGMSMGSDAAARRPEQPRIPEIDSAKRPGGRDVSRSLFYPDRTAND